MILYISDTFVHNTEKNADKTHKFVDFFSKAKLINSRMYACENIRFLHASNLTYKNIFKILSNIIF